MMFQLSGFYCMKNNPEPFKEYCHKSTWTQNATKSTHNIMNPLQQTQSASPAPAREHQVALIQASLLAKDTKPTKMRIWNIHNSCSSSLAARHDKRCSTACSYSSTIACSCREYFQKDRVQLIQQVCSASTHVSAMYILLNTRRTMTKEWLKAIGTTKTKLTRQRKIAEMCLNGHCNEHVACFQHFLHTRRTQKTRRQHAQMKKQTARSPVNMEIKTVEPVKTIPRAT